MVVFLNYVIDGIMLGLIYALVASGYSLIFSILRIVNFAHGSIYAFGSMMGYVLGNLLGINPWLGVLISMILTGILCALMDKLAIEPLRRKNSPGLATLITTIGISYIIQNALILFLGSNRRSFKNFYDFGFSIKLFGVYNLTSAKMFLILITAAVLIFLTWLINHTEMGLDIRAVQENQKAARLMGINVERVVLVTFFLAGASAAIAGVMVGGYYQVCYPTMGAVMGNKTLATALLGGLGAMQGGIVGGIIIGIMECIVAGLLGATFRDSVSFIILIIVLIVIPRGLFGKKGISKV